MSVLQRYQRDLQQNGWQSDAAQHRAVTALDDLHAQLQKNQSRWPRWLRKPPPTPRGLYLWGGVGRGKTYLMDLFYEELGDVPKRRQHFHRFMLDVQARLLDLKDTQDPLAHVAEQIHAQSRVICFDEFFVSDIADAMILGRLFKHLFRLGTVLVATSNVAPKDLYHKGLHRDRFLPAIDILVAHTNVLEVDDGTDYRLRVLKRTEIYHSPNDAAALTQLNSYFDQIAPTQGSRDEVMTIEGRPVPTVRRADGIVWFTFDALCDGPRGAADYIEIARTFQTVLISEVPRLDQNLENEARRFITLVDEFYDRRVKLLLSADCPLEQLYTGQRLSFEFERTRSRLIEMQSEDYLAQPHLA